MRASGARNATSGSGKWTGQAYCTRSVRIARCLIQSPLLTSNTPPAAVVITQPRAISSNANVTGRGETRQEPRIAGHSPATSRAAAGMPTHQRNQPTSQRPTGSIRYTMVSRCRTGRSVVEDRCVIREFLEHCRTRRERLCGRQWPVTSGRWPVVRGPWPVAGAFCLSRSIVVVTKREHSGSSSD